MKPISVNRGALEQMDLSRYSMELKFDGWRIIVILHDGAIRFYTRDKKPVQVPEKLRELVKSLRLPEGTVLDGEIWNPEKRAAWTNIDIWDVIKCGHQFMGASPIEERRQRLSLLVPDSGDVKRIQVVEPTVEVIKQIEVLAFKNRNQNRLESGFIHGVVLKKNGSIRHDTSNRCKEHGDWVKYVFDGMKGYEPRL